ncbi:MAG: hypothetical protein U5N86_05170 [Planctomycetota bacterium]|nr:hypothetical protein [Planctomycetota bacterium]
MFVLVIGNIGAGKTRFQEALQHSLQCPGVGIDDIREKYLKSLISEEYESWVSLLRFIETHQRGVIEFSGIGIHKHTVRKALELHGVYCVVHLVEDLKVLQGRLTHKKWGFGNPFNLDATTQLDSNQERLSSTETRDFWSETSLRYFELCSANEGARQHVIDQIEELVALSESDAARRQTCE